MTATAAWENFPPVSRIRSKDFSRPSEKRVILSNSTTFVNAATREQRPEAGADAGRRRHGPSLDRFHVAAVEDRPGRRLDHAARGLLTHIGGRDRDHFGKDRRAIAHVV